MPITFPRGLNGGCIPLAFTASNLWTPPSWVTVYEVWVIASGGGGGSGAKRNAGTSGGGAPGTGGGASHGIFPAAAVGSSIQITVGVGGAGGALQSTNGANGNNGADGQDSSFGTLLSAGRGWGGGGGTTAAGVAAVSYGIGGLGIGATPVTGGLTGAGPDGPVSLHNSCGSGGGGAGISAGLVFQAGGNAGLLANRYPIAAPAGGTSAPTAGQNAVAVAGNAPIPGFGGGGGGTFAAGGNGAVGGGGGGGGCGVTGVANSGPGGNGGNGLVYVVLYG